MAEASVEVVSLIKNLVALPAPQAVLRKVAAVARNEKAHVDEIVEAVRLDPAIAGLTLRLANTWAIDIPRRISSLKNAVEFLGAERLRPLMLVARRDDVCGGKTPAFFPLKRFWRHSVLTARIAESICRHMQRYVSFDEQELYAAGILHDAGKLALALFDPLGIESAVSAAGRAACPFSRRNRSRAMPLPGVSSPKHGTSRPSCKPPSFFHHDPAAAGDRFRFAAIVHVADTIAHLAGHPVFTDETIPAVDEKALAAVPIPA